MFEQFTKAFQNAGAGPAIRAYQEAATRAQRQMAKVAADATEYAQMEIAHAVSFTQAGGPQQAFEIMTKAAQERQAFLVRKSKAVYDEVSTLGAQWVKSAEVQSAEMAQHASGAMNAAFSGAKQGLDIAESAAKSVVAKASKAGRAKS